MSRLKGLGVRGDIVPSVRTSNQRAPKQTGQQGFGSVEKLCSVRKSNLRAADNLPPGNFFFGGGGEGGRGRLN